MKIAGNHTKKDWNELKTKLNTSNDQLWEFAFVFFEERISTRYLNPINAILDIKLNNGEGFSVVNLQCSLIETIESFINGWIFQHPNYINREGIILKGNEKIFKSFFNKREPFINYFPKINSKRFYVDVRCGLLHETQTKNNWKIKKGTIGGKSYEFDGVYNIIYRDNFQKDILLLLDKYKDAIINGNEFDGISVSELRENFVAKMNHICNKS